LQAAGEDKDKDKDEGKRQAASEDEDKEGGIAAGCKQQTKIKI